jgi:hypothetical protein
LSFADGQVKTSNHAENGFAGSEAQRTAGGLGEGPVAGTQNFGVDPGVDDVEFSRIDPAGGAVVAFGHKSGHGDDGIRSGEQMFATEGRAGAFGEVAGKDDQGFGLHQSRRQEGGPVVIPVVGMDNPGARTAQNSG